MGLEPSFQFMPTLNARLTAVLLARIFDGPLLSSIPYFWVNSDRCPRSSSWTSPMCVAIIHALWSQRSNDSTSQLSQWVSGKRAQGWDSSPSPQLSTTCSGTGSCVGLYKGSHCDTAEHAQGRGPEEVAEKCGWRACQGIDRDKSWRLSSSF